MVLPNPEESGQALPEGEALAKYLFVKVVSFIK